MQMAVGEKPRSKAEPLPSGAMGLCHWIYIQELLLKSPEESSS